MSRSRNYLKTDSSAGRLIQILAARGPMTVRELVEALGVTTTAVRQQVDRLLAEGWIARTRRSGRTGRPADVFEASIKAARMFAGLVDDFAAALVTEMSVEIGREKSRELLEAAGRRISHELKEDVGDGPRHERLERLMKTLSRRGVLADAERTSEGACVTLHRCPFGRLAEGRDDVCRMERALLGEIVGETPKLHKSIYRGHRHCAFTFPRTGASDAKSRNRTRS